ncbi:MAG: biotin--[acetyl-CoA-carboxylase] ligase, partial [Phycisphaeraceae bacterium JB051]
LIEGKKLAGILVETMPLSNGKIAAMIGIGLNVNLDLTDINSMPMEVRHVPTSLKLCGQNVDRLLVLHAVLSALKTALNSNDTDAILNAWRQRSMLMGTHQTIAHNGKHYTGTVEDLDLAEGLILRTDHGSLVHLPAVSSTIIN